MSLHWRAEWRAGLSAVRKQLLARGLLQPPKLLQLALCTRRWRQRQRAVRLRDVRLDDGEGRGSSGELRLPRLWDRPQAHDAGGAGVGISRHAAVVAACTKVVVDGVALDERQGGGGGSDGGRRGRCCGPVKTACEVAEAACDGNGVSVVT